MRVKINSTGEIKEVKQVGDKLFDKENNCYSLSQVILLDDWRPASEPPRVMEDGDAKLVVIDEEGTLGYAFYCVIEGIGMWDLPDVKWWCYPPKFD